MRSISKNDLINLKFNRTLVTAEESGCNDDYYFYTYDVGDSCLLISDASDENDDNFTITFFNSTDIIQIKDMDDLKNLIQIVEKNIVKKNDDQLVT